MVIRIELNPETEARLTSEARAKGLAVEKLAEELLDKVLARDSQSLSGKMSIEEFHQMLKTIAAGSERLPDLPTESFSRQSFYEDRVNGGDSVPRR